MCTPLDSYAIFARIQVVLDRANAISEDGYDAGTSSKVRIDTTGSYFGGSKLLA